MHLKSDTIRSFSVVFLNNLVSLVRGIIVAILVPRLLSVEGYADYKVFTLYASYIGLLHFGFVDGICVKFAGKNICEIGEGRLRLYTRILLAMEATCSIGLLGIVALCVPNEMKMILSFVAVDIFLHNMVSYFSSIFQITMQFKKYTAVGMAMNIFQILSVGILFVTYVMNCASSAVYISLFMFCNVLTLVCSIALEPKIIFGPADFLKNEAETIREMFAQGVPLLIAGIVATLILNIDRQFVSILFSKSDFAMYSFAYSMMSLITTLITSVSIVLYPTLKKTGVEQIAKNYQNICEGIELVVFAAFLMMIPLCGFVLWFLPTYKGSLSVLIYVCPSVVMMSLLQIVIINYYKTLEKTQVYFKYSIFALVISFLMNALFYYLFRSMQAIAVATVLSCLAWFLMCNASIAKMLNIKTGRMIISISYLLVAYYISYGIIAPISSLLGMAVYGVFYILGITVILIKRKKRRS